MSEPASYSTAAEGGAPVQFRYIIEGRIDPAGYLAFVADRAGWLDISGWACAAGGRIEMVAAGPEALVGALEMACTLGPIDALVERIEAVAHEGVVAAGFEVMLPSARAPSLAISEA